MPTPTKLHRLLDLIVYLACRRAPVAVERLLSELPGYSSGWRSDHPTSRASARRAFERDKEELRAAGFPIRAHGFETGDEDDDRHGQGEGYTLAPGDLYLPCLKLVARDSRSRPLGSPPSLELTESEAGTALDALRHVADVPAFPFLPEARAVYRKLTFDLDPDRFGASPVGFMAGPRENDLRPLARTLAEALHDRRRVHFHYRGIARNQPTLREVAPYGLLFHRGQWYLIGHDELRGAIRTFRLSRIQRLVSRRADSPEYEIPEDFDLSEYAGRRPWELGDAEERPVRVRFRFPASLWAERNALGALVEWRADGSAIRTFDVLDPAAFGRWVLSLAGDAEIELPAEMRRDLESAAARIAALHENAHA